MRVRIRLALAVALITASSPARGQTVVSNHPPLSPDEAVRVLRSSHSLSDMANRPLLDPDGPRVFVVRHDPDDEVPRAMAPPEPLGRDLMMSVPYGAYWNGGMPLVPFGVVTTPRRHARPDGRAAATPAAPQAAAPPPPPRHVVMGGAASGGAVRRFR